MRSTPAGGMVDPFCSREPWRPANLEPTQSSSRGISPIVTCRLAALRLPTRLRPRDLPVAVPFRKGHLRRGARTTPQFGTMLAKWRFTSQNTTLPCERARLRLRKRCFPPLLPPFVLDAVSANLAILKSPTVLRLENGDLWGWEGCFPRCRLLPWFLHARVELCPGLSSPLPATGADSARTGIGPLDG